MDCIRVSQNIEDYLHGELGRLRQQAIARHIDGCAYCAASAEFSTRFQQMLWAKCRDEAPPELRERVLRALEEAALPTDFDEGGRRGPLSP